MINCAQLSYIIKKLSCKYPCFVDFEKGNIKKIQFSMQLLNMLTSRIIVFFISMSGKVVTRAEGEDVNPTSLNNNLGRGTCTILYAGRGS